MTHETLSDFLIAATPPRDGHASGTLDVAESIRAAHPDVQRANILACAVLGDADGVRAFIEADPASATSGGGPFGWDALTHLCFSRYLRIDRARSFTE